MRVSVPLEKKIALAFGAALALVVMTSVIAYQNTTALLNLTAKADEAYEVLGALERLASLMKDVETGQRGFILTRDQRYLEPYESALRRLPDSLDQTKRLVGPEGEHRRRLGTLEKLIASRTAFAAHTIHAAQTLGQKAAEEEIRTGKGKEEMDRIRGLLAEMQADEQARLRRRSTRAAEGAGTMIVTIAGGGMLAGLVLLLAGVGVRLDLTGRKRAEEQMRTRAREQAAIAELGLFALRCPSLTALMDRITSQVAEVLAVDYCKILERMPDGHTLQLVAGVGWKEGCVGHAVVEGGECSQAGYTLSTGKPVIVDDFGADPRFTGPPLLHEHQVRSGLSVIIHGHHEKPFGVLGVHTRSPRSFTEDDAHFLEAAANILGMAVERKHDEEVRANLAAIVESSNDAIIGVSLQGRIQSWNTAAQHLFGYTAEEALGQPLTLLRDQAHDVQQSDLMMGRLNPDLSVAHSETVLLRKDGHKVPVAVTYSPIRDAGGTTIGISKIARDVTERRQAQERLQQSQIRQALIMRALPVVMYSAAPWGEFGGLWVSENTERVTGFSPAQLVDDPQFWASRLHLDDRARALKEFEGIQETGTLATEYRWRVADGTYHWFLDRAVLVRKPDGTPKEINGVWMDITDRKLMEEALRETNETLTALIHASPVAITVLDPGGNCTLWNPAAERIFGWTATEVLGHPLPTVPSDREVEHRAFRERVLQGEGFAELDVIRQRKDGSRITVSLYTAPLHDPSGKISGVMGLLVDITDRKIAQQQLVRSHEQLRALTLRLQEAQEEEQRRIAREIHDELGQALTGMKFDLVWLHKQLLAAGGEDLIPDAMKRLYSLLELVDGTVQMVRRIATTLRPSVLDDLGLVAALEWQVREFQERTGVRCALEADPRLNEVEPARSTAIFRIAQEALTNVARHADAGSVILQLCQSDEALRLVVKDNGQGIPAEAARNPSGLGLLGMRERAAAFGGDVTIRPGPGGGTIVIATIPTRTSVASGA